MASNGHFKQTYVFNLQFYIDFFCMKLKLFSKESYQLHLLLPLHHQDWPGELQVHRGKRFSELGRHSRGSRRRRRRRRRRRGRSGYDGHGAAGSGIETALTSSSSSSSAVGGSFSAPPSIHVTRKWFWVSTRGDFHQTPFLFRPATKSPYSDSHLK